MTTYWVTGQNRGTVCVQAGMSTEERRVEGGGAGKKEGDAVISESKALMGRRITEMGKRRELKAEKTDSRLQSESRHRLHIQYIIYAAERPV